MGNMDNGRPLGFETLEERILLAGDVTAVLSGATLIITGDGNANDIAIAQDESGNITVQGNDGTSINQNSSGSPVAFAGVTNVSISLNGGDDRLTIGGEEEPVDVTTSAEEHEEEDPQLKIAGWLFVATGTGDDVVRMSFTEVAKDVTIITDGGDDAVDLGRGPGFGGEDHVEPAPTLVATVETAEENGHEGGGPPSDVRIGGSLTIITCAGDDGVKVGFTDVQKNVTISSGLGNDDIVTGRGPVHNVHGPGEEEVAAAASTAEAGHAGGRPADTHFGGVFTVLSGQGDDMVVIRNTDVRESAFFVTDGGNDALALDNVGIGGCTSILQGFGDDVLLIRGSDFGKAAIAFTGMGNDAIYVEDNHFASSAVLLADGGNDAVTVKGNHFGSWALLAGGSGTDALEQADNSFASFPFLFSFERDENSFDFGPVNQKINDSFFGFMMGGPVG